MTTLFDQFAPLFELTREMDRMFARNGAVRSYVPAADVVVTDEDVYVHMDVPGLGVDDLEIELVDDVLTIKGERAYPYAAGNGDNGNVWQRLERGFGKFERVVRVPQGLDPDTIDATIADGVLTLHLPKPEARKPHRVAIKAAAGQPALGEGSGETQAAQERELAGATA
jgi:HSP20 family protein